MNHQQALEYLDSFTKAGKPVTDLSRFRALAKALGDPQKNIKFIHIAGTNGKGSVCEYISQGLINSGFSVGKFTSPYINFVEERIQLNSVPVSQEDFAGLMTEVKAAADRTGCMDYSQFELLTAAAFLYYRDCDFAVIETGIGGTLDCTNIIDPVLSVITTVDLDHCAILGNTPAEIASHKAGIIKPKRPAVTSPFQYEEVLAVLRERAESVGAELTVPKNEDLQVLDVSLEGTEFCYKNDKFRTKMCGKHQAVNAAAAIEALRLLGVSEVNIRAALETAAVPARMERLAGWVIDGAHNVSGARAAAELISGQSGKKLLLTGMLKSKDWQGALELLAPLFDDIIAVDFFAPDAVPAEKIAEIAERYGKCCVKAESPEQAVKLAEDINADLRLVCGSLYLCGKMRQVLNTK